MPFIEIPASEADVPVTCIVNKTCRADLDAMNSTVNDTSSLQQDSQMTGKDASWILTSAVIIFTMQTGFGLLEAGCVSHRSEANIMIKNALDVVFGGVTYWAVGFAFSFGDDEGSNPFIGVGHFFVQVDENKMGFVYALFMFQLSFATTATTIVSGAMVERTRLVAYNVFSMVMTLIYCLPAHWMWAHNGFLHQWGATDIAGCGPVHLVGGITGLVATVMIGARKGAFDNKEPKPLPSPVKAILGMFMLWWGWLRFNSGSVFVVTTNSQWKRAVRAAVNTIVASMGGGVAATVTSLIAMTGVIGDLERRQCGLVSLRCFILLQMKCCHKVRYDIGTIINGVLGSLVSVTAICTLAEPWEAFIIGCMGSLLTTVAAVVVLKLKIDDPVGVIPVHAVCGFWGLISVGLFIRVKDSKIEGQGGVFYDGQFYMLGIQAASAGIIAAWTIVVSSLTLKIIDLTIGLRLTEGDEKLGADFTEHGIKHMLPMDFKLANFVSTASDLHTVSVSREAEAGCSDTNNIAMSAIQDAVATERILTELLKALQGNEVCISMSQPQPDGICLHLRVSRDQHRPTERDSGVEIYI